MMKKLLLYISLILLISCNGFEACQDTKEKLASCEQINDSLSLILENDTLYCQNTLDSLQAKYTDLNTSWMMLIDMVDSLMNLPPVIVERVDTVRDTILWMPQCTLCYKDTVNINGVQYYVGYDGRHYKLFLDQDTVVRQTFYKDTNIVRYILHDSLFRLPEMSMIIVQAKGTICEGEYPRLNVRVNGELVKSFYARSPMYNQYAFVAEFHEHEIDSITVEFDNDLYKPEVGEDRNAYVNSVKVNYHEYLLKENTRLKGYIGWYAEETNTVEMKSNGIITIKL